jgi:hypothetical protein
MKSTSTTKYNLHTRNDDLSIGLTMTQINYPKSKYEINADIRANNDKLYKDKIRINIYEIPLFNKDNVGVAITVAQLLYPNSSLYFPAGTYQMGPSSAPVFSKYINQNSFFHMEAFGDTRNGILNWVVSAYTGRYSRELPNPSFSFIEFVKSHKRN